MRLDWRGWWLDLLGKLLRSIGVSGGAWLGIELKYKELNYEDLLYCVVFGAVLRTLFHFFEENPLPRDLDAKPPPSP